MIQTLMQHYLELLSYRIAHVTCIPKMNANLFFVDLLNEMLGVVPGIIDIIMLFRVNLLHFQCLEDTLHIAIVIGATFLAHTDMDTMFIQRHSPFPSIPFLYYSGVGVVYDIASGTTVQLVSICCRSCIDVCHRNCYVCDGPIV